MVHHHANENEVISSRQMLPRLGITDYEQKDKRAFGGSEKASCTMFPCLITPCDVSYWDEPTKPIRTVRWRIGLENKLQAFRGPWLW